MDTKKPRTGSRGAGLSKSTAADFESLTQNHPDLQAASLRDLRAAHLIARHHIAPATALALAGICWGGAHG
jgi:hypothetical protein